MIKTSCEHRIFPASMRWLHAGGDLPRPNSIPQRTDRALPASSARQNAYCTLLTSHTCRQPGSNPAKRHAIIEVGASIKSP
jgi:hypothetical protein